jgi:hypothetical protein
MRLTWANGFLVPPFDVDAMAAKVSRLIGGMRASI